MFRLRIGGVRHAHEKRIENWQAGRKDDEETTSRPSEFGNPLLLLPRLLSGQADFRTEEVTMRGDVRLCVYPSPTHVNTCLPGLTREWRTVAPFSTYDIDT
jgi:hypothetical protein